jgi:hypothetical protein
MNDFIDFHYALQTCDFRNSQKINRFATNSKHELVKKCVTSFLISVDYLAKKMPDTRHTIAIFDDQSSNELISYLKKLINHFTCANITFEFYQIKAGTLMPSVRMCWEWLEKNGKDVVYQVQDDYLYEKSTLHEMGDVFFQIINDIKTHPFIVPYHDPRHWLTIYRYKQTPRVVVHGAYRYWLQCYDIPCTFMTSKLQFSKHWDMYEKFLAKGPTDKFLETDCLNRIVVDRNVLCLMPFESLALHMQSELEKDPYIDWKSRWDSVVEL